MCPSDSRQVSASRTTRRLPRTACSMLSVSWSKVCLNHAACCWEMVIGAPVGGLPRQRGLGLLERVVAVHGDGSTGRPVVAVRVGVREGVEGLVGPAVDRAEDQ